jgi:hypothetical protein
MRDIFAIALLLPALLGCAPEASDLSTDSADTFSEGNDVAARSQNTYEHFRGAIEAGASCAELFDLRNEADPSDPLVEQMNEDLGSMGCLSRSSTRQTSRRGGTDLYSINYKASYMVCSHDPNDTLRQAGTDDPEEASAWLASGVKAGEAYEGSYDGCLDALTGKSNRFPS